MIATRRIALAVACVFAMLGMVCPPASAQTATKSRLAGRPLIEVLREMQTQGLRLIFSSDLVSANLRVTAEPHSRTPRAILAELLAPHGLTLRDGPRNTLLIVRASVAHAPPRVTPGAPTARDSSRLQSGPSPGDPMIALLRIDEQVEVPATTPPDPSAVTEVATRIHWKLTDALPTTRTLEAAINLVPGLHDTGPSTNTTIAGAMSSENVIMLNGVQITDNIRGTPFNLFIEDAIEQTTVSTAGISAEYGRFSGGLVNAITKSGGNDFEGSLRVTLNNDAWRSTSPFGEAKSNDTQPTYEYTLGGPVLRNRTWFFTAGRMQENVTAQTTAAPASVPYEYTDQERRLEAKITHALAPGHSVRVGYIGIRETQKNYGFGSFMDLRSLTDRKLPQSLLSVNYHGVLSSSLFIEGQYSSRHFTFQQAGGLDTDRIRGTLLIDQQRGGLRYWSPSFCGVCGDERRDNDDLVLKGTWFRSTRAGSHNVVFGYDTFSNKRFVNNHQSASDYRIYGTTSIVSPDGIYPVFGADETTYIQYNPILQETQGTDFAMDSLFANDTWRVTPRLGLNVGLRWDHNRGRNGSGVLVVKDASLSPRLGAVWDARGDGMLTVTASYARYVASIANAIADGSSPGGQPATFTWFYRGPPINTDPTVPLVPTDVALEQLFAWFDSVGGPGLRPLRSADIPGTATRVSPSLRSPHADEASGGVSLALRDRGSVRVDYIYRTYRDFYALRNDLSNGTVTDPLGQMFDLTTIENTNLLSRRYQALQLSGSYRLGRLALGGNYTLSQLYGTMIGETVTNGPFASTILSAREYFDPAWSYPEGDLGADERHRLRAWGTLPVPMRESIGALTVSAFESVDSGTPYGALGNIDTRPYVVNPGYVTPPAQEAYYFTARDAFRTQAMVHTDVAVNYTHRLIGRSQLFLNAHVLNVFNQFARWNITSIDTSILTRRTTPDLDAFNPFTTQPVQDVNWRYGPAFGTALDRNAYTVPRTFRFALGLRF
jgi:TonB dependent receptor